MNVNSKQAIWGAALILWIVFSLGYIGYDQWQDFQVSKINQAYQAGITNSVNSLITESEKCQPIKVYNGEKNVEFIAVSCLQQGQNQAAAPAPEAGE
ncbi:hypothetical protein COV49_04400 [Candidatus Falkowbacteria bacterium CG11_big_fil_rev_8_21_14_0_20_39_10]|uniref:Uncharacterized protein n=1 Tax=Candidatus Falkowbacteria bacterium CG11_big_fil_rev_8_21_14_0_20_39_10 TaxID=1974570 RepID=A0A2M6K859_9BACT|nr:MAG: hypothetical protein COV49_04400 [Candidatus Falkowbacteria bacterium CG11_big_fil_rev_8_21_14_0_20_39_10]